MGVLSRNVKEIVDRSKAFQVVFARIKFHLEQLTSTSSSSLLLVFNLMDCQLAAATTSILLFGFGYLLVGHFKAQMPYPILIYSHGQEGQNNNSNHFTIVTVSPFFSYDCKSFTNS